MLGQTISYTASGGAGTSRQPLNVRVMRRMGLMGLMMTGVLLLGWWCITSALSLATAHSHTTTSQAAPTHPVTESVPPTQTNQTSSPAITDIHSSTNVTDGHAETNLQVNGQSVPVPDNGSIHKEIHNTNGSSSVDISVGSSGSASNSSSSSTTIQLDSHSRISSSTSQ